MGEMGHSVHLGARAAAHVREQVAEELLPVEGLGELHEEQIEERLRRPTRAAAPLLSNLTILNRARGRAGSSARAGTSTLCGRSAAAFSSSVLSTTFLPDRRRESLLLVPHSLQPRWRRKARPSPQTCLLKKRPICLLKLLAHIDETDAGLDKGLRVCTDLWAE